MKCETNRELQMKLSSLVLAAALKPAFQNGIWSQLKRLRHQSQESATCCNSCIARPVSSCFRAARALRGRSMTSPWRTWDTKECIGRTHGTSEAKRMNLWNETADRIGASWEGQIRLRCQKATVTRRWKNVSGCIQIIKDQSRTKTSWHLKIIQCLGFNSVRPRAKSAKARLDR